MRSERWNTLKWDLLTIVGTAAMTAVMWQTLTHEAASVSPSPSPPVLGSKPALVAAPTLTTTEDAEWTIVTLYTSGQPMQRWRFTRTVPAGSDGSQSLVHTYREGGMDCVEVQGDVRTYTVRLGADTDRSTTQPERNSDSDVH